MAFTISGISIALIASLLASLPSLARAQTPTNLGHAQIQNSWSIPNSNYRIIQLNPQVFEPVGEFYPDGRPRPGGANSGLRYIGAPFENFYNCIGDVCHQMRTREIIARDNTHQNIGIEFQDPNAPGGKAHLRVSPNSNPPVFEVDCGNGHKIRLERTRSGSANDGLRNSIRQGSTRMNPLQNHHNQLHLYKIPNTNPPQYIYIDEFTSYTITSQSVRAFIGSPRRMRELRNVRWDSHPMNYDEVATNDGAFRLDYNGNPHNPIATWTPNGKGAAPQRLERANVSASSLGVDRTERELNTPCNHIYGNPTPMANDSSQPQGFRPAGNSRPAPRTR